MKNFFKIFFISFLFLVSLGTISNFEGQKSDFPQIIQSVSQSSQSEVALDFQQGKIAIVSQNTIPSEIYTSSNKQNSSSSGNLFKAFLQNRTFQSFNKDLSIRFNFLQAQRLSRHLKHEICTRAP
jgi:hypothetical protein